MGNSNDSATVWQSVCQREPSRVSGDRIVVGRTWATDGCQIEDDVLCRSHRETTVLAVTIPHGFMCRLRQLCGRSVRQSPWRGISCGKADGVADISKSGYILPFPRPPSGAGNLIGNALSPDRPDCLVRAGKGVARPQTVDRG